MNSNFRPSGFVPQQIRSYQTYQSPYGPKYKIQPNIAGFTVKSATKLGLTVGAFGGVAGFFAIFFLSDVPRLKRDVLQHIPLIGNQFVKEIPPSDNMLIVLPPKTLTMEDTVMFKVGLVCYSDPELV